MVLLLIIDDLGMRKLPHTAAEDLLELIMRRYERASALLTSNRLCGAPHKAEHFLPTVAAVNHLSRSERSFAAPPAKKCSALCRVPDYAESW